MIPLKSGPLVEQQAATTSFLSTSSVYLDPQTINDVGRWDDVRPIGEPIEPIMITSPSTELLVDNPSPRWAYDSSKQTTSYPTREDLYKRKLSRSMPATPDMSWGNKVAFSSAEIFEKQKYLETHTVEMQMMIESILTIASRAIGRPVSMSELDFYANFGTPIVDNKRRISIGLNKPMSLQIIMIHELVDGKLKQSAEIGYKESTPITAIQRLRAGKGSDLITNPIAYIEKSPVGSPVTNEEPKKRKVKI